MSTPPTKKRRFHRLWQKCPEFVHDLFRRQYAFPNTECEHGIQKPLPDGFYWYLYELWQDGRMIEREKLKAVNPTLNLGGLEHWDDSFLENIQKATRRKSSLSVNPPAVEDNADEDENSDEEE